MMPIQPLDSMGAASSSATEQASILQAIITKEEIAILDKDLSLINERKSVTLSELLALFAAIIDASQRLRTALAESKIQNVVTTQKIAVSVAELKQQNSFDKFVVTAITGTLTMAVSMSSAIKIGQTKVVQDKHLPKNPDGSSASVKDLTMEKLQNFSTTLQEARKQKYTSISRLAEMSGQISSSVNEASYASAVQEEDETSASKELVAQFNSIIDQALNAMTQELIKMNETIGTFARANAATNR